jgi:hypothetical protein
MAPWETPALISEIDDKRVTVAKGKLPFSEIRQEK